MDNLGMVAYVEGSFAFVNFQRKGACGDNCASCGGSCEKGKHLVRVFNNLNAQKGDLVQLNLDTADFLKMSLLLYVVPLIVLIVGIIAIDKYSSNSALSVILGIVLTGISFFIVNKYVTAKNRKGKLVIQMDKIVACQPENLQVL